MVHLRIKGALVVTLAVAVFGVLALAVAVPTASAIPGGINGAGLTPTLGWSSWSFLRMGPTAANIEASADALVSSGLASIGYQYINLDDFYYQYPATNPSTQGMNVDQYGRWVTDPTKFPPKGSEDGIAVVADYVHSLGLKFGIYLTPGIPKQAVVKNTPIKGTAYHADDIVQVPYVTEDNYNQGVMYRIDFSKPGAQKYYNSVANRFASWGIDYLKFDGIKDSNAPDVIAMSKALQQTGRPMRLDTTQGSQDKRILPTVMQWATQTVFTDDIEDYNDEPAGSSYPLTDWANVSTRFNYIATYGPYCGPGWFNDSDSIEVGNGANDGTTPNERMTQMSLWALGASPFILGVDLTNLDSYDLTLLKNTDVIAVDQDSIGASRIVNTSTHQVFTKTETNGDAIVGLFNTGSKPRVVSTTASAVGQHAGCTGYLLTNLWSHQKTETAGVIAATVPSHGVALYRISPLKALFVQTNNLGANRIIVYDRAWDGTLTRVTSYLTGGKGGMAAGSAADPLSSQGSLASADHGRVLLAVNAGSDSISLFRVHGDRLSLAQVAASGGQFPASIAVYGDWVYVLNAGGQGSVQGYWLTGDHLWRMRFSHRSLGLGNTNPPDYLHSPGQVGFSPDGRRLIVATKASTSAIDIFWVGARGVLGKTLVANSSTSPVPFAFTFDPWGRLVVVEAAMSHLSTYSLNPDNSLTGIGSTADGFTAACWISAARGFYYISNAGSGNVSAYTLNSSGVPVLMGVAATIAPGVIDSVATPDQRFLYVECSGAGELLAYRVNHDGTLTWIQTISGLPTPPQAFEGIAVN